MPSAEPMSAQLISRARNKVHHRLQPVGLTLQGLLDRLQSLREAIGRVTGGSQFGVSSSPD